MMDASAIVTEAQVQGNVLETGDTGAGKGQDRSAEVERFRHLMEEANAKIDELEHKVNEVAQFCSSSSKKQLNNIKGSSFGKDREKEKQISSNKKNLDPTHKEAASTKRMQDLMRQFATILRQITQHKWAWPFMEPVDVEGLHLHDYYKVIKKPMDLGTIRNQMEAKDGTGYKNVREIYADVRLVFHNAMMYNDEKDDVHVMAKTLLDKFEEKWLQLLPKVVEEEERQKQEEAEAYSDMQLAQEAANAKLARDISNEVHLFPHLAKG